MNNPKIHFYLHDQIALPIEAIKQHLTSLLLLLSLLLGGCQPLASLAANKASSISLNECILTSQSIKAKCGTLRVPEDRTNPAGRLLDLRIIVVPARGSNPQPDPLFYITGGPGGVATDHGIVNFVNTIFLDVNNQRDIVFLDQRGTNDKHRLACAQIPSEVVNGTQQQMNDWMKECLSSLDGDPRFYTTAEAMRDLDAARAALGYKKINLYGGSYGAAAVQVYMRMFPKRVRTAVLDHGTALDLPFFQALPNASQSALDHVFSLCEQDEKCHAAYPDLRGDWQAIRDRLAKGPVVTSFILPGEVDPFQVDMDMVGEGLHNTMFQSGGYAKIPSQIHAYATSEDWTPLVKQSFSEQQGNLPQPQRTLLMTLTIFCFEPAWGNLPAEIARLNPDSYLRDYQVKLAQGQQKTCASLPKPDPSLIYDPGKPAPLSALMLNSLIDPQNPPSNMEPALREFTKSRLVIEPTEGHETSNSECRYEIIARYIQQGSVDGLDISCMEKQKPSFVVGNN
jgi:pimeloyl-ACP methyl ester carboxylesterase